MTRSARHSEVLVRSPLAAARRGPARLAAALAGGAAALVLTASCTSSTSPGTAPSTGSTATGVAGGTGSQQQLRAFEPALVQCFASHGLIPTSALTGQSWYHGGKVAADNNFYIWWTENDGIKASGKELIDWLSGAINNGTWPALCGPMPTVSPSSS
jgi:hypothetical protein